MELIKTKLKNNLSIDKDLISNNPCFLDIETTGLSRNRDIIYLIGILYFHEETNTWVLDQIFANKKEEEKELLLKTLDLLSNFDTIINYNGNAFDIPFINQRLLFHSIDDSISKDRSLDIYSIIRSNRNILDLKNLKLKTIEEYLGIIREDIYSGKDCIEFYNEYLVNSDESLKKKILQHNYDDLYYLLEVIKIIDIINDKKSFSVLHEEDGIDFIIDNIKRKKDYLIINGSISRNPISKIIYYGNNYKIKIEDNKFEFDIEIKEGLISPTETCIFIDRNDYNLKSLVSKEYYGKVPENLIILEVEKKYMINNIKKLLSYIMKDIFRK